MPELWSWESTWQILPELARAAVITIEATLLGFALAAILGLVFAILRMSRNPWIANPITGPSHPDDVRRSRPVGSGSSVCSRGCT